MNGICRKCNEPNNYNDNGLCKYCYAEKIGGKHYAQRLRYLDGWHAKQKKTALAATSTVKELNKNFTS